MKLKLPFIFFLLVSLTFTSPGQTEVSLAPGLGDGMVLQLSANTMLHGSGPPGKPLTVKFWNENRTKPFFPTWKTNVDNSGHWQLPLDLTAPKFQAADAHWSLLIEAEKTRRQYDDIILGDVIILAGWEGQGIAASVKTLGLGTIALFDKRKSAMRFLDLSHAPNGSSPAPGAKWENWPGQSELSHCLTLTLRLAYQLAETNFTGFSSISANGCVGIVLVGRKEVTNGLAAGHRALATIDDLHWHWIIQDAHQAQSDRSKTLVLNKRQNIVTNIPPITDYDPALCCPGEAFDTKKPPLLWFTFAGAIWSASP